MIGHIESYDDERQTGAIKCKGKFYEFHIDEWNVDAPPEAGDDVDFMPEDDGSATNIGPVEAYLQDFDMTPVKNHYVAGTLGLLFGFFGVHRFYLGFYKIGILQTLVSFGTLGFGIVWPIIDAILIFAGHVTKDAKGRALK